MIGRGAQPQSAARDPWAGPDTKPRRVPGAMSTPRTGAKRATGSGGSFPVGRSLGRAQNLSFAACAPPASRGTIRRCAPSFWCSLPSLMWDSTITAYVCHDYGCAETAEEEGDEKSCGEAGYSEIGPPRITYWTGCHCVSGSP